MARWIAKTIESYHCEYEVEADTIQEALKKAKKGNMVLVAQEPLDKKTVLEVRDMRSTVFYYPKENV